MTIVYILIFIVAAFLEVSHKMNTRNLLKKGALTLIMLGAILILANRHNYLIEIGTFLYLIAEIGQVYYGRQNRRAYDKAAN
jgi:uncharacterized membrane protein